MRRRQWLSAGAVLGLLPLRVLAQPAQGPEPRVVRTLTLALDSLQQAVAQRLPLRTPVAGLLDLELADPHLSLLPAQNRLRTQLRVGAQGPLLAQPLTGRFTVDCGLRYEAQDRTLRATDLALAALDVPGLSAEAVALLMAYAPLLAQAALGELVLHRLTPQETALGDLLGLQPGRIRVTETGLLVELVARSGPLPG